MTEVPIIQDDEELTEILGPKCPECGWRRGEHRPQTPQGWLTACPQWEPGL